MLKIKAEIYFAFINIIAKIRKNLFSSFISLNERFKFFVFVHRDNVT